jgi:hypothetical protein
MTENIESLSIYVNGSTLMLSSVDTLLMATLTKDNCKTVSVQESDPML